MTGRNLKIMMWVSCTVWFTGHCLGALAAVSLPDNPINTHVYSNSCVLKHTVTHEYSPMFILRSTYTYLNSPTFITTPFHTYWCSLTFILTTTRINEDSLKFILKPTHTPHHSLIVPLTPFEWVWVTVLMSQYAELCPDQVFCPRRTY